MATELCKIAKNYGTDKVQHGYTLYYDGLFKHLRDKPLNLLEIGIFRGHSIQMWNEYFRKGEIYCIDNCVRNSANDLLCSQKTLNYLNNLSNRNHAIDCCQKDKEKLNKLFSDKEFDIVIDDGQHFQEHQQKTLGYLFKNVKPGGTYIVEDICSMWGFRTGSWWGQLDGVTDTNAFREGGQGLWLQKFMASGKLKEPEIFSDSTWSVLHNFKNNKVFQSPYLSEEENKYLQDNIAEIEIIAAPEQREEKIHYLGIPKYEGTAGTQLSGGCIAIIRKRN